MRTARERKNPIIEIAGSDIPTATQVLYHHLTPGEQLTITATDAATQSPNAFRLTFIGWTERDEAKRRAIVRLDAEGFSFYGADRRQPQAIAPGTLALAGTGQTHLPYPVDVMVMMGGIGFGRDYSFDFSGGNGGPIYVANVATIERHAPECGWERPGEEIRTFLGRVEEARIEHTAAHARREARLCGALTVRTLSGSTYELSAADGNGLRTITKVGEGIVRLGWLGRAVLDESLFFECQSPDKPDKSLIVTSPILSISPDPDRVPEESDVR